MRLKVIACEVAAREIYYCAAHARTAVDVELLPQGLHEDSDRCRSDVQARIDAVPPQRFNATLLGYGLCSNSMVGLRARSMPLVLPRAHDCITLFLGSKERYAAEFAERPDTYYYTAGWIECARENGGLGDQSGLLKRQALEEFIARYGEENGRFLFEESGVWIAHYRHGALIRFPFQEDLRLEERVREICREKGWSFRDLPGDLTLLRDWLNGAWDDARFLVVQPGQEIQASHDEKILRAVDSPAMR